MTTNTKTKLATADARATADAAVADWRAAANGANAEAAQHVGQLYQRSLRDTSVDAKVAHMAAQAAFWEAENAEQIARARASVALDAVEPSDPEEAALVARCGMRQLRDRLAEALDVEARARAALASAEQSRAAVVIDAYEAHAALSARRSTAGLPGPSPYPADEAPTLFLAALTARIADPYVAPSVNVTRIARLRREETQLRADAERSRREREDDAQRKQAYVDGQAAEQARVMTANAERTAASIAAAASRAAEDQALAEAHRNRGAL